MPYIGRDLNRGNYLKLDDISSSFNGSTQTFNLTVGGSAFTPGSAFAILVSVGGVIQEPESAYQVSNSEITFANAPTAQDSFFCIALGVALGIGVPGNGTVNGTQMAKPFNYDGYFYLDDANNRVGINSSSPTVALDVDGIVKASSFTGGSGGINAGVGTFTGLDLNGNGDVSGNFVIGGDLTVNGTTSTIDTNLIGVDRVEVGANSSTIAGIAVTQSGTADILNLYDGSTEVFSVADGGAVTATGNLTISNAEPSIFLTDTNANPDYKIFNDQGAFKIYDTTYSATRLQIGPSNGEVTVLSNTNFPNGITMNPGTASVVNTIAQRLGDTDTKIRFPANDTFTVETSGSERLRVGAGGSVGIGITTPSQKLNVIGEAWIDNNSGDGTARSDGLTVSHAPGSNFTVGSDPSDSLRAASFIAKGSSRAAIVTLRNVDDNSAFWDFIADGNTNKFYIQRGISAAALGPAVTIDTSLNVGIGTATPDQTLELFKASGTNLVKVSTQANSTVGLEIEKTGSTTQTWRIVDGQTINGALEFYDVTDSETRLMIDTAGRILINRTSTHSSSSERLSVNGMTSIQLNSTSTAPLYVFNQETTADGTIQPFMYFSDGAGLRAGIGVQYSTSRTIINGQFGLSFRSGSSGVSGTERLRIDADGKIKLVTAETTDYLQYGNNPRLWLKCPSGINGMRIDASTTPLEIKNSSANGKSFSFDSNFNFNVNGDYSLSSSGYDSSGKIFLNATRHNGSTTVTSFQTSIQAVATSNANNTGYLGLGASATPDDLVIKTDGKVGINETDPSRILSIGGSINLAVGSRIESYSSSGNLIIQGGSTYPGGHIQLYGGSGDDKIVFNTSGSSVSSTPRMTITSAGRVLINNGTSDTYGSIGGNFHVINANMGLNSFANNPHAQTLHLTKSRATSGQGGTIVQDNDFCGHIEWYADDGVDTSNQIAKISGRIDGTPGTDNTPGELIFHTTPAGANASTERVRITASGDFQEKSDGTNWYNVVTGYDIGTNPNEIPINQMLGGMAYMDPTNYEQVYEIPSTNAEQYGIQSTGGAIRFGTFAGGCPDRSISWPDDMSGGNPIDLWVIDIALHCTGVSNAGRNDLYFKMTYNNGSGYVDSNTEWNNWILARNSYSSTSTGWNQINNANGSTWGRTAVFMDANQYVTGHIILFRGGAGGVTRPGLMWDFNYTHGGVGATRAFGSAHATMGNDGNNTRKVASLTYDLDASSWIGGSAANSQNIAGFIRQRGYRLQ